MKLFNKNDVEVAEVVEGTEVVEVEKGFHPIQKVKSLAAAHPKATRVVAGVAAGLAIAGATLVALGKKAVLEDEDEYGDDDYLDEDDDEIFDEEVAADDEAAEN